MKLSPQYKKHVRAIISGFLFLGIFLGVGVDGAQAAPIKILSNSNHVYSTIVSTINQLLGTGHVGTDIIVHRTALDDSWAGSSANAALASTSRYDESGTLVPSQAPYHLFTSSFTGYPGDSVAEYNLSATYDLANNYAFSNSPAMPATNLPPTFFVGPGGSGYASGYGVEWTLDPAIFCTSNLSCLTAANAGMMAALRFNHPTWNWFDVKAALRQTGTNWATGYNRPAYGFGQVNYAVANALTDGQLSLQPPAAYGSVVSGKISFTLYPFKQTRRVKEVLFQFPSAPAFQANELTLSAIEALGGTKITENTGVTATTTTPIYVAVTNAYFVWLTADNAADSAANFSRIDTYSVRGPLSQNEVQFDDPFDIVSPTANAISTTTTPTLTWDAASSYLGIAKYQLFIDGVLDTDNISGTSATPSSPLSPGTHTWYVKAFNGGGISATTTSTPTLNINPDYISGYTFYVDNVAGDDDNPGTQALPWATLAKAGATVVAGNTVVIIKNANQPYRETLAPSHAGTVSAAITFRGVDAGSKPEIWGSDDVSTGWSAYSGGNPDTYQRTVSTEPFVIEVGASLATLTKKIQGTAAATLNPGEWYWASNVLYYRLAAGEVIESLRIEAASRDYGVIGNFKNYITYQNLVVRYANSYGVYLTNTGQTAYGVEAYDSESGIYLQGTNTSLKYSLAARNNNDGVYIGYPQNAQVYNSLMYGNGRNGANFFAYTGISMTLKNNISSESGNFSFGFNYFWGSPTFTTSNNLWDIAGDSNWTTYKGTDNQELVDPLLINPGSSDFALQAFSPVIDAGTAISGLTADILGNPIYGAPDIGAYEYQPPYDMDTDQPNDSVSVRMYGDGKFRNLSSPSGAGTVPLSISSDGNDRSQWLDLDVSEWTADHKEWTEASSNLTGDTDHTVSGLDPDTYYEIAVDSVSGASIAGLNCSSAGMCLSDSAGGIAFSYSGGYSTHTFEMTKRPDADPLLFAGTPTGTVAAGTTSASIALSTLEDSTCKYASAAGAAYADMTGSFSTTGTMTHATSISGLASGGSYVYYVKCLSSAGNVAGDYAISFSVALDELADELDIDSPSVRQGDGRSLSMEETLYLKDRKFKLSATMSDIAGGTVEISRNGGAYKTVRAAASGKWSTDLRTKKEGRNTFGIVYKNADGTIVSSQKRVVRVDTKKPVFTLFPTIPVGADAGVTKLSWDATDDDRLGRYKVYFSGRIYSSLEGTFLVPEGTQRGQHELRVRAIDRSGNTTERSVLVFVR